MINERWVREITARVQALERAFEGRELPEIPLVGGAGPGAGALADEQYLVLATSADLSDERRFVDGDGIQATDGGAGGDYTVAVQVSDFAGDGVTDDGANNLQINLSADANANLLGLAGGQLDLDSQTANLVFAAPNGGAGKPSFRALVADDLPADGYADTYVNETGDTMTGDLLLADGAEAIIGSDSYVNMQKLTVVEETDDEVAVHYVVGTDSINNTTPTYSTAAGGTWSNVANVASEDGSEASYLAGDAQSGRLRVTFNSPGIPGAASIVGVIVYIKRREGEANDNVTDYIVTLLDGTTEIGENKANTVTEWPLTRTTVTYGSATDTWAAPLTAALINSGNFGVGLYVQGTPAYLAYVDWISVTVYYTTNTDYTIGIDDNGDFVISPGAGLNAANYAALNSLGQWEIGVADGTAPLVITSTTVVSNLNVDQVDGYDGSDLVLRDGSQALTAPWDAGQIITVPSLKLDDTGADHTLQLIYNEDATADRVLNLDLDDGTRALTLQGDLTVAETMSAAGRDVANTFTSAQTIDYDTTGDILRLLCSNSDMDVRIGADEIQYGYDIRYVGSGVGINNTLEVWADNTSGGGGAVKSATVYNDGTMRLWTQTTIDDLILSALTVSANVNPTIRLDDLLGTTTGDKIGTLEYYSNDTSGNYPAVGAAISGVTESSFGNQTALAFYTNDNSATPSERVRILATGEFGINETAADRLLHIAESDTETAAVTYIQRLTHETSNTPDVGFGVGLEAELESTTANRLAGALTWEWDTATDATRASRGNLTAYYTTTEETPIEWWADSDGGHVALGDYVGGDYAEIESDGTLKFNGGATFWDDVNVGALNLSGPAATQPDIDTFVDNTGTDTGISTYAFEAGEEVDGALEVPHWYKQGSDFTFHIHWQGKAAPTGTDNVRWQLTYCIADDDTTLSAATTITVETAFDTQYEFKRSDFAAISGTGVEIGDQFIFVLERIAATSDEYAGDALVATVGVHFEGDTVGSRLIGTK